jgi:hypothetical protein
MPHLRVPEVPTENGPCSLGSRDNFAKGSQTYAGTGALRWVWRSERLEGSYWHVAAESYIRCHGSYRAISGPEASRPNPTQLTQRSYAGHLSAEGGSRLPQSDI